MGKSTIKAEKYLIGQGIKTSAISGGEVFYIKIRNIVLVRLEDLTINSNTTDLLLATGLPTGGNCMGVISQPGNSSSNPIWRLKVDSDECLRNHWPIATSISQGSGCLWYYTN